MFKSINRLALPCGMLTTAVFNLALLSHPATAQNLVGLGRAATPAEVSAWDIDVRPDFKGLPAGSGSVEAGADIFEQKCASCHGSFGESNSVFTPLTGGVVKEDIIKGRVKSLVEGSSQPQRTTFMKVATLSTVWDYINRAMPWNAPRTLTSDEVYALTAYLLSVVEVVPPDFVLSHQNIREVQNKMPNRLGMTTKHGLWTVDGVPDTQNIACMKNCPTEAHITSFLPDYARNQHGNLLKQNREYGSVRGQDTERPSGAVVERLTAEAHPTKTTAKTAIDNTAVKALLAKHTCTACHQEKSKLVGPSFVDIAKKYGNDAAVVATLSKKAKEGGQGVWGQIPMPANAQVPDNEMTLMIHYILNLK